MKSRRTRWVAGTAFALLGLGCITPGGGVGSRSGEAETLPAMVKRALPAVVLVIAEREDGQRGYGAGVWADPESPRIFTAQHVVEGADRVLVMPYRTGRQSYTPMDGGLDRFLFENEDELRLAKVVSADPVTDLAILELRGTTPEHVVLARSKEDVHAGEKVLALGHAQETVWSFTSGVVSALHAEAIQHDAALNPGSSGGPLINERGELLGINTIRVVGGADGVGFARPIHLADTLTTRESRSEDLESSVVDLSSVRAAARSCFRAQELGSPEVRHCFDWSRRWEVFQRAIDALSDRLDLSPAASAAFRAEVDRLGDRGWWTTRIQERTIWWVQGEPKVTQMQKTQLPGVPEARRAAEAGWAALVEEMKFAFMQALKRRRKEGGLQASLQHNAEMQETLKKGLRVESVEHRPEGHAWVLLQGRNPDSSPYWLSEYWGKEEQLWKQHSPVPTVAMVHLPDGWPRPVDGEELAILREQLTLIVIIAPGLHKPIKKALSPPAEG